MMASSTNVQDTYLNKLRKEKVPLTVFLLNDFQLIGVIKSFDNFTVLIETEGKQQLIFKHAISTFAPSKNIELESEILDEGVSLSHNVDRLIFLIHGRL